MICRPLGGATVEPRTRLYTGCPFRTVIGDAGVVLDVSVSHRIGVIAAILVLLSLFACADGGGPLDDVAPSEREVDGLQLRLTVEPDTVALRGAFTARVVIANLTADSVRFSSPSSCLAFVGVYRGDERQRGFEGTDYFCLGVVTSHVIVGGASLTCSWRVGVRTWRRGDYKFRVDFDVVPALPRLEHAFVVR